MTAIAASSAAVVVSTVFTVETITAGTEKVTVIPAGADETAARSLYAAVESIVGPHIECVYLDKRTTYTDAEGSWETLQTLMAG
ncbi:hypothetical protein ACFVZM_06495 [Streptomyces sioyaensis]|uniref:hypothetical protein n=1 Tax=Streptomyces sioyaensis TaxID=67364 RepID=UPI0036B8AB1B